MRSDAGGWVIGFRFPFVEVRTYEKEKAGVFSICSRVIGNIRVWHHFPGLESKCCQTIGAEAEAKVAADC